jgi:hypothetical protein
MTNKNQEFENFSALTKRLLSVPKKEVDKRHEEWTKEKAKDRKHKAKRSSGRAASRDSGGDT